METTSPSFEHTDKLYLSSFCDRLQRYLFVESDFVEGSLVVSLDAEFGAGKTTFLHMWATRLLEQRNKPTAEGFSPMPIMLNAWESDYAGDPLVAILGDLTEALEKWEGKDKPTNSITFKEAAIEAVKDTWWFSVGLAGGIASEAAKELGLDGLDPLEAADFAEGKKSERKPKTPDFIQRYRERKDALKKLRTELLTAFAGTSPKVIVFVDELDRCRPDYAVSYLETIKHVFDVKGMVFVLAMNRAQFACSVKAQFGVEDFPQYMRKFVHRTIKLPRVTQQGSKLLFQALAEKFLEKSGMRILRFDVQGNFHEHIANLFWRLDLCPRQWSEAFRLVGHALEAPTEWQGSGNKPQRDSRWAMCMATVLLSALHIKVPGLLERVAADSSRLTEVCPSILQTMGLNEGLLWIQICVAGDMPPHATQDDYVTTFLGLGISELANPEHFREQGKQFMSGWGESRAFQGSALKRVAERLLHAATIADSFE